MGEKTMDRTFDQYETDSEIIDAIMDELTDLQEEIRLPMIIASLRLMIT